jgi:hypothetical protein
MICRRAHQDTAASAALATRKAAARAQSGTVRSASHCSHCGVRCALSAAAEPRRTSHRACWTVRGACVMRVRLAAAHWGYSSYSHRATSVRLPAPGGLCVSSCLLARWSAACCALRGGSGACRTPHIAGDQSCVPCAPPEHKLQWRRRRSASRYRRL